MRLKTLFASPPAVVWWTTLAYAVVGCLLLGLRMGPASTVLLFLPAGIGLAAMLVLGRSALWGVYLGSAIVSAYQNWMYPESAVLGVVDWILVAMLPLGSVLQVLLAAWLLKMTDALPLGLRSLREVLHFFTLAGPVACLAGASLGVTMLLLAGAIPRDQAAQAWLTWWLGDSLGVMIGAPLAFCVMGRPHRVWGVRRLTVGLPLLLSTLLICAGMVAATRWDEQRRHTLQERDANMALHQLRDVVDHPRQALQAMRALYLGGESPAPAHFRQAAAGWLGEHVGLISLGVTLVAPGPAAKDAWRATAPAASSIRHDPASPSSLTAGDVLALPITQYESAQPLAPGVNPQGLNMLSRPAWRDAIRLELENSPSLSPTPLMHTVAVNSESRLTMFAPLPGLPAWQSPPPPGSKTTGGLVFVEFDLQALAADALRFLPENLAWCLVDTTRKDDFQRLAGTPDCVRNVASRASFIQPVVFADRHLQFTLAPTESSAQGLPSLRAWAFSLAGVCASAMLGALLLTMTGRAARIERAVNERTQALQHEVQERRRTSAALKESERRLRAIVDSARVGIVTTDLDGVVLHANPAYCRLLGRPEDAVRGVPMSQHTQCQDLSNDTQHLDAMKQGVLDSFRIEKRFVHADGHEVPVQVTASVLRNDDGKPYAKVCVVEDVAERLRLAEAELARDAAEASNRAKTEFVSRMSHELRTPLNAMLGFAQLMALDRQPRLSEKQQRWTSQIQQAGWHLLQMINDTLDLSRIESGQLRLDIRSLDAEQIVINAMALVKTAAEKRGITMQMKLDRSAPAVMGDETRTMQILTNLLNNAVKYNVDGGTIQVRVRAGIGPMVELQVTDTGLGMSREQMAQLFEPYNRLGRERSTIEGTGIGLVISRRLAEGMGGALRALSAEGKGSTFILTLPRGDEAHTDLRSDYIPEPTHAPYSTRRVLYIEDNATNVEVMRGILLQREQVQLEVAVNGQEGVRAIRQNPPHLLLLDMHLPDMDGLEILQALQTGGQLVHMPVIVLSADATGETVEAARKLGARHYLTKPVNVAALLAALDAALEEAVTV